MIKRTLCYNEESANHKKMHFYLKITSWYTYICWDLLKEKNVYADMAHFICVNIVTQSMFVESAHLYVLKDMMAGIYWLVELGPGALAEIISVCNRNFFVQFYLNVFCIFI